MSEFKKILKLLSENKGLYCIAYYLDGKDVRYDDTLETYDMLKRGMDMGVYGGGIYDSPKEIGYFEYTHYTTDENNNKIPMRIAQVSE